MAPGYDVAVVGAGPCGLFAVFELGCLGLKSVLIDALGEVGGQCSALYPEKPIYDVPGLPEIKACDLVQNLKLQAFRFNPDVKLGLNVTSYSRDDNGIFTLQAQPVGGGEVENITCRSIIIAAGGGSFVPKRPEVYGINEYEGKGVEYFINQKSKFAGKRVVIAGGGDSAVDWAIALSDIASEVRVVHRRARFRASEETCRQMYELADAGKIVLDVPFQLHFVEGNGDKLERVVISNIKGDISKTLETDYLLPFFGLAGDLGPLLKWGLKLSENGLLEVDPATMKTNVEGIYAIGDVCNYQNKLKLILVGFSEGAFAAKDIRRFLFPGEMQHFEYSTTMFAK